MLMAGSWCEDWGGWVEGRLFILAEGDKHFTLTGIVAQNSGAWRHAALHGNGL